MNNPKLSALMVTYGRTAHVQRALQCFLNQDYPNRELIILNTFPGQKLTGDFKDVRIVNLDHRPPSLGACRNIGVKETTGDLIVTHDDDDLVLPNHLSNFAEQFSEVEWVWMENQFYSEKGAILKFMSGSYNTFAFTKKAWETVGGFNELSVGEDRHFVSRVTSALPGKRITLAPDKISFIYCWANGAAHISGLGEDKRGLQPAYVRSELDLKRRVKNGMEPMGTVELKPESVDTQKMADDFLASVVHPGDPMPVCIVELGRIGDVINLLPICKHIAEQYGKPHLMVSRPFASVLDGVSYVIPEVVDIPYEHLNAGVAEAQRKFPIVMRGQIWGSGHHQEKQCASYNEESWRELGFLKHFKDPAFPLVFDRRDAKREQQLVDKLKTDKPMLLVKVTGGMSSPFPTGERNLYAIRQYFGADFNVVDLSIVQCERIYDLLGLMDVAAGLITIDTATIHLAAASTVPVLAIVNPTPWAGTTPRCNCVARLTYTEIEKNPRLLLKAIPK